MPKINYLSSEPHEQLASTGPSFPIKNCFSLPPGQIYLCGHSLGPPPLAALGSVSQALQDWNQEGINSWNKSQWIDLPQQIGALIAPLIGAQINEVIVADSTSINLFKVLLSALDINASRKVILTEKENFPADLYIAESVAKLRQDIQIRIVDQQDIIKNLNQDVAVLLLSHVNYRTGALWDLAQITKAAHQQGILVIWDLSHSVGAMPMLCSSHDVDFAVGCTYKYLNGGPGSPGFIYVNQKHQLRSSPIYGWMGHQSPFVFNNTYVPAVGINRYLGGTPSILSMKALHGALTVFHEIDLQHLRETNIKLSEIFIKYLAQRLPELVNVSPQNPDQRGMHIAFSHSEAFAISRALLAHNVICDYREPDIVRFSISPLYLTETDLTVVALIMIKIISQKLYALPKFQQKGRVT